MNNQFIEAREFVARAREALRRGDRPAARQLGEQAARRAPKMEDVWLILAASDPDPRQAMTYARKALQLNPQSPRARRAVEWAAGRLKPAPAAAPRVVPNQAAAITGLPQKRAYQTAVALPQLTADRPNWLLPALMAGAAFAVVGTILFLALTSPLLGSLIKDLRASAAPQENLWAPVEISHPEVTPIDPSAFAVQPESAATSVPEAAPSEPPAAVETLAPTEAPSDPAIVVPAVTETPGSMVMEIVTEEPTSEYVPPKEQIASSGGARWIDVDLTNQTVYAYEGDTVVNSFVVSTGTWLTPTVTGKYKIYVKIRSGNMSGPGYFLPDVPYIMYFHKGYGLHGTYWHTNFGTPMSHGCVNLRTDEAGWLFNWASVGTVVNVHY
jgi:lipoprotein-anchoring transpeptidase ErfK/SrfK